MGKLKEVHEMTLEEYMKEYKDLSEMARTSELKGHLTPGTIDYIPMTEEEVELHEKDWREFSRRRGYTKQDIDLYSRWRKISGQENRCKLAEEEKQGIENSIYSDFNIAVNDPWRRNYSDETIKILYQRFLELAKAQGIRLSDGILLELATVKNELESDLFGRNLRVDNIQPLPVKEFQEQDTQASLGLDDDELEW